MLLLVSNGFLHVLLTLGDPVYRFCSCTETVQCICLSPDIVYVLSTLSDSVHRNPFIYHILIICCIHLRWVVFWLNYDNAFTTFHICLVRNTICRLVVLVAGFNVLIFITYLQFKTDSLMCNIFLLGCFHNIFRLGNTF